jgi:hypothetical protein
MPGSRLPAAFPKRVFPEEKKGRKPRKQIKGRHTRAKQKEGTKNVGGKTVEIKGRNKRMELKGWK